MTIDYAYTYFSEFYSFSRTNPRACFMWFLARVRNPALILVQQNVHAFSSSIKTQKKRKSFNDEVSLAKFFKTCAR